LQSVEIQHKERHITSQTLSLGKNESLTFRGYSGLLTRKADISRQQKVFPAWRVPRMNPDKLWMRVDSSVFYGLDLSVQLIS